MSNSNLRVSCRLSLAPISVAFNRSTNRSTNCQKSSSSWQGLPPRRTFQRSKGSLPGSGRSTPVWGGRTGNSRETSGTKWSTTIHAKHCGSPDEGETQGQRILASSFSGWPWALTMFWVRIGLLVPRRLYRESRCEANPLGPWGPVEYTSTRVMKMTRRMLTLLNKNEEWRVEIWYNN
jgi:hypothetical protein